MIQLKPNITLGVTRGGRSGGTVISRSGYVGFAVGATGTANITGPAARWTVTNSLYVGGQAGTPGGTGHMTVANGGSLVVSDKLKLWNAGTLKIGTGGSVTARNFDKSVGTLAFNDGTLTISGGVYTHTTGSGGGGNILTINGNSASAVSTFELANGATATGVEATIIGSTGQGQLLISNGSMLFSTGDFSYLDMVANYDIFSGFAYLGLGPDSTGTATVNGTNSQWTVTHQLYVGYGGTGALNVSAGGHVYSDYGNLSDLGGVGMAIVTGESSRWTITQDLYVGANGPSAALNVNAGGRVTSDRGFIGVNSPATGTATITGANSQWTMTNELYVGYSGTGTLNVTNGGNVISHTGFVGNSAGSMGTATISGAGSQWTVTNALYVGGNQTTSGGTGTITITDGGTLQVGGLTQIWQTGSVHVGSGSTFNTGTLTVMQGGQFTVDAGGTFTGAVQNTGEYVLNGVLTGDAVVNAGGEFGGSGVVVGKLSGEGLISPGNSPGILDAIQIDPTSGLDFLFEFTLANAVPDYLSRTMPGNDVLHLTDGANPFLAALTNANKITIDFQIASLNDGDIFLGGFFTNLPGFNFAGTIGDAEFEFLFNGSALDTNQWHVGVSSIPQLGADFGPGYGGSVNGRVMQVQVQAVPEPGSMILCGIAACGLYLRRRRSNQNAGKDRLAGR